MFDDSTGIWGKKKRKRTLTPADKKRIAAKQDWKCKLCGGTLPARYHVDHIKEFSEGGSDRESNLQALCSNCHSEKTEEDRHRKKQKKIREGDAQERGGSPLNLGLGHGFGSSMGKGSGLELGLGFKGQNFLGEPKKKGRRKKKSKPKGPFDFGF